MSPHRFFLARTPDEGEPELPPEEARHARQVLRLAPGAELFGLDGAGGEWPLRLERWDGRRPVLASRGTARRDPAPGEPGAALPWVEVAVAWPRSARAEAMLDRLVQLGVAAVTPLDARASGPEPPPGGRRLERLVRIAESACKQSGRTWLPVIGAAVGAVERARALDGAPCALLDPRARLHAEDWLDARASDPSGDAIGTRRRPLVLAIGPEGGFQPDETAAWLDVGATPVALHPHVLRIETAAEAVAALVTAHYHRRSRNDT
jgi:16S rRNA (uracil1498-N3)-methyltransferase